ncbi:hypothetical protein AGMMS50284_4720 [Clostridia bacterium]|nr:hypothetical protein AGMMS50284_4720 [Clostridia bacterium]
MKKIFDKLLANKKLLFLGFVGIFVIYSVGSYVLGKISPLAEVIFSFAVFVFMFVFLAMFNKYVKTIPKDE